MQFWVAELIGINTISVRNGQCIQFKGAFSKTCILLPFGQFKAVYAERLIVTKFCRIDTSRAAALMSFPTIGEGVSLGFDSQHLGLFNNLNARVYLVSSNGRIVWRNENATRLDHHPFETVWQNVELKQYFTAQLKVSPFAPPPSPTISAREASANSHSPVVILPLHNSGTSEKPNDEPAYLLIAQHHPRDGAAEAKQRLTMSEIKALLTPTEWRLAMLLHDGKSLKDAAAEMQLSYHTVRKYLQNVFSKTNLKRQVDLVLALQTQ